MKTAAGVIVAIATFVISTVPCNAAASSGLGANRIDPCSVVARDRESIGQLPANPVVHERLGDDLATCARTYADSVRACQAYIGAADAYTAAASILDGRGNMHPATAPGLTGCSRSETHSAAAVTCVGDEASGATEPGRDALNHFTEHA